MKSIRTLGALPAGLPISADDVLEFHAGRILLLLRVCGVSNKIDGLTKMAKLDFFVRYPQFFDTACRELGLDSASSTETVESSMIRFHYGPWDERYYHVLSYLEAKGLVAVTKAGKMFQLTLTEQGNEIGNQLQGNGAFSGLVEQMKRVKKVLGGKAGSTLKKLIYSIFEREVGERPLGEVIQP
jgi:hypothetical protein